jgi:hypothetical protein
MDPPHGEPHKQPPLRGKPERRRERVDLEVQGVTPARSPSPLRWKIAGENRCGRSERPTSRNDSR